jgi:hypothetical protein
VSKVRVWVRTIYEGKFLPYKGQTSERPRGNGRTLQGRRKLPSV